MQNKKPINSWHDCRQSPAFQRYAAGTCAPWWRNFKGHAWPPRYTNKTKWQRRKKKYIYIHAKNHRSTYLWIYRCNRLQTVGGKQPIKAMFTFKVHHFDLFLQSRHHFMTQQRLKIAQDHREHNGTWTCDPVTRKRPNHSEEMIRSVLDVCSRKPGGGDRSI